MNNEIAKRIVKIRLESNLNQKDFAIRMNISQGYLSKLEQAKIGLTEDFLLNISSNFNVNINWLLAGLGDQYLHTLNSKDKIVSESSNIINIEGSNHKITSVQIGDKIERKIQRITHPLPEGSISPEQAQTLLEYVNNIVKLADEANYYPAQHHAGVWAAFKKRFRIPSYRELPSFMYEDAVKYFQKKIGIINQKGFKSRNKSLFVKNYIKSIHAIYKTRLKWTEEQYRDYLFKKYGVNSSLDLTDAQISNLYHDLISKSNK